MNGPREGGPPRRRVSRSAIRLELLVFVEGQRTEETYLVGWRRLYRDRVLVAIDDFRGAPLSLVQHAIEAQRTEAYEANRGRGRPHDQIWCVFDVDQHPNITEALALAAQHNIHVALSNPCLEVWFLLHFGDQNGFIDRHAAQGQAEAVLHCSKSLSGAAVDTLVDRYEMAKARAIRLDAKHEADGSPPGSNPSSGMWRLVDMIRQA